MRVAEMCEFVGTLRGVSSSDCDAALQGAELTGLRERSVAELSGGQRQRLSVALATLGEPAILLLDEPTVGLDLRSRDEILRRLKHLKAAGKTIVIASHIPEDIVEVADRVIVMEEGRVIRMVTCAEFEATIQRIRAIS
jgi:ABC-type multidrug transport system ATPase subunit